MSDPIGTIEPGKLADIIAVGRGPREDVTTLEYVSVVIRDGEKIK